MDLASARKRIRGDATSSGQECGEALDSALTKNLSRRLNSLVLLEETDNSSINRQAQARESVITRTPTRVATTSTPSSSPVPPPIPPKKCLNLVPPIPISSISRSCSLTGSCSDVSSIQGEVFTEGPAFPIPEVVLTITMEQAENAIQVKADDLLFLMSNFDVVDVNSETILDYKEKLDEIGKHLMVTTRDIRQFVRTYSNSGMDLLKTQYWNGQISKLQADVRNHRDKIIAKVMELRETIGNSIANNSIEAKKLELKEREVAAKEALVTSNTNQTLREADEKRNNSLVEAKAKASSIISDVAELDKLVNETTDWKNATDITVKKSMRKIEKWRKEMNKIIETKREFNVLVEKNQFTDEDDEINKEQVEREVQDLKEDLDAAILSIENEDNIRALYTLDITPVADPVKLPKFAGKEGEDFHLFKEEMEKGFIQNRIPTADQLLKLRECLSGAALTLVPKSSVTTIAEAWSVLKKSYGDVYRVIKYRKDELMNVGKIPKVNDRNKGGYSQQIAWFLKVENLMRGILDLGAKHPEYSDAAFSLEFISSIIMMFPQRLTLKLDECQGQRKERMENILAKIEQFREKAQRLQLCLEASSTNSTGGSGGTGGGGTQQYSSVSGGATGGGYRTIQGLIAYKPPRRDENCRICNTLETEGDTENLYDDHFHNFPTGCPRYILMNMKQRFDICRKAKLCLNCHDPEYTFKATDKNHNCAKGKKSRYTCTSSSCRKHMWVCERHRRENKDALERFKEEYQKNHKMVLGLFTAQIHVNVNDPPKKKEELSILKANGSDGKDTPAHRNISTKEATRKLKRKLSSSGESVEVRPIPAGRAQFMIGQTKGKTRPLNIFYDSGCYSLLLKEGVQHELGKSILKTKGPVFVNGVGNTNVKVNDEWITTLQLLDGSRQAVEGWTVDEVTAPLPKINLSKAVKDIKADKPENKTLQKMVVQLVAGGECDILLGQMYLAIFPKPVHSLPSGLTIYELQITPHDERVNSLIGGPHESFELMAQQVGGANFLFSQLMQTLDTYNRFGPPRVSRVLMTQEDEIYNKQHKEWGLGNFGEDVFDDGVKVLEQCENLIEEAPSNSDDEIPLSVIASLHCTDCGVHVSEDEPALLTSLDLEEESTQALKKLQAAKEEGLQIEYRCPRCRSCNDCRRSFQTERVSLREEAEDQKIFDSVNIDWDNKQIVCSLPLRGEEHEFLSNNREIALKVLDQQCYKYHKDEETRDTIVKAFEKLMKNKHMVLFDDLSDDEKKQIESKPVSHWIPWRVVFKHSLSTPARPVFDGSMNTKVDEHGRGGRSLNDLVVKGKVTSLNLVKMIIRFQTGTFAVQGDLKQFYASIKLVASQ